ncbi:MaoC family dehydratase [Paraburkholderia sacchari]|uniref:MaoC family dehydratase n=1 Tax=Paraburkholderia sacchari TaxID=159450 RepID=UPI0005430F57|nr:MaoC family dehydratase [Paraburkholderia sacchari]NLP64859.1 MaoC family dehydratase [Paraburkholderia sacchari]
MTMVFHSADEIVEAVGKDLGVTAWLEMEQGRVTEFAGATNDHQWIHVDPERAAEGPFGGCIAHGYLTLSLAGSYFLSQLVDVRMRMGINYGCDRVRFPAAVPVGARVRARGEITRAERFDGGVQATIRVTIEIEGNERPACVADTISRYYFD